MRQSFKASTTRGQGRPLVWKMIAPIEETEMTRLEDQALKEWVGGSGSPEWTPSVGG